MKRHYDLILLLVALGCFAVSLWQDESGDTLGLVGWVTLTGALVIGAREETH